MSKRRAQHSLEESDSDNGDDFDPLEFAALENYENSSIKGLKQLQQERGTINNTVCSILY